MERFLLLFSLLSAQSCQLIISDTLLRNVFVTESQHAVDNPQSRKACKETAQHFSHDFCDKCLSTGVSTSRLFWLNRGLGSASKLFVMSQTHHECGNGRPVSNCAQP